jgi:hypothetical protein
MPKKLNTAILMSLFGGVALGGAAGTEGPVTFTVSIDSVMTLQTLAFPDGSHTSRLISPGVYVVAKDRFLFLTPGQSARAGLERVDEVGELSPSLVSTRRDRPELKPTQFLHNEDFTITGEPGDHLHLAVIFAHADDVLDTPREAGIDLFTADGRPVSGEMTASLVLWNAGTDVNEAPSIDVHQASRPTAQNKGDPEQCPVALANHRLGYPRVASVLRLRVSPVIPSSGEATVTARDRC